MGREPFGILPGRAAARLARIVDRALADVELTMPQYRVLVHLAEGNVAASALADWLSVSRPAITTLVDGLVAKRLVNRATVAGDRRRVDHALTPEGIAALEKADAAVERALDELASHLPAAKRRRAFEGLELWAHALDDVRAQYLAQQRS